MAKRVQIRGLTTAQLATNLGRNRELIVDTSKKTVTVHDKVLPGGFPLAREDLANVAPATNAVDGKMTAALVQQQETNTAQITVNQANISQNAADIAQNVANIAANAAAIAAHEARTDNPHSVTVAQIGALAIAQNLADLSDLAQAISNLGIKALLDADWEAGQSAEETLISPLKLRIAVNSYLNWPAGQIIQCGFETPEPGIVRCDGASYPTATYPELYGKIGNTFGGDVSNFNVPNIPAGSNVVNTGVGFAIGDVDGALEVTIARANLPDEGIPTVADESSGTDLAAGEKVARQGTIGSNSNYRTTGTATEPTLGLSASLGSGDALTLPRNPYIALPFFITTGGT